MIPPTSYHILVSFLSHLSSCIGATEKHITAAKQRWSGGGCLQAHLDHIQRRHYLVKPKRVGLLRKEVIAAPMVADIMRCFALEAAAAALLSMPYYLCKNKDEVIRSD